MMEFDEIGLTTPETRAAIMGVMVRYVASLTQPATFSAMFAHLMEVFSAQEEEIGGDLYSAHSILVLSGLIISSDSDPRTMTVRVTGSTTIRPSIGVTDYVWRGPAPGPDDSDEE